MNPTRSAIRLDGFTKRFSKQVAVDGLTLDVPEGAVFGLLGENGAGKTTTIQTILGFLAPDSGRVEVLGLDPLRNGIELRRQVGYVPEVPNLYDWMTVSEIGWFAAGFHPDTASGPKAYIDRFHALTHGFELPSKKKIKTLSKGMRAKVSLSLALASQPKLLVLDEPTSGLDLLVRRDFLESMVDLAGEGRTVLLSSHQIGEVERVASHVALVHQGKLIACEPLDDLRGSTYLLHLNFSSLDHAAAPPDTIPVTLIDAENAPRQSRWLVRARERSTLESLRTLPNLESLDIATPNLEEIYIGYMRNRKPSNHPAPNHNLGLYVA